MNDIIKRIPLPDTRPGSPFDTVMSHMWELFLPSVAFGWVLVRVILPTLIH